MHAACWSQTAFFFHSSRVGEQGSGPGLRESGFGCCFVVLFSCQRLPRHVANKEFKEQSSSVSNCIHVRHEYVFTTFPCTGPESLCLRYCNLNALTEGTTKS